MGVERLEKIKEEVREKQEKYKFECETGRQKEKKTFKKNLDRKMKEEEAWNKNTDNHSCYPSACQQTHIRYQFSSYSQVDSQADSEDFQKT